MPNVHRDFPPTPPMRLLCLSHLAWERGLFQRPQQLMTRFARRGHSVRYLARVARKRHRAMAPDEQKVVFEQRGRAIHLPYAPLSGRSNLMNRVSHRTVEAEVLRQLDEQHDDAPTVLWLQHPDYEPLVARIPHALVVYDCMDPHEAFAARRPGVLDAENRLLARADVVFTGGRSLQESVARRATDVVPHCFPSGIDFEHFARAAEPGTLPEALRGTENPVLGYFGAVDERIDWELVSALCAALPHCEVLFAGPLVGLERCPVEAPNFRHVGAVPYDDLPEWLRGFAVALLPWKLNDLTRRMSPTKIPEYLAAGKPVVSVAIPDVEADYGEEVAIATPSDFAAACERALERGPGPSRKPAAARTWEEIAEAMETLMRETLAARGTAAR